MLATVVKATRGDFLFDTVSATDKASNPCLFRASKTNVITNPDREESSNLAQSDLQYLARVGAQSNIRNPKIIEPHLLNDHVRSLLLVAFSPYDLQAHVPTLQMKVSTFTKDRKGR